MSWMAKLYETYENCSSEVGKLPQPVEDQRGNSHMRMPLLPVAHSTQNAQLEITLDLQGNFLPRMARVLDKGESMTIIPCTEESASRTSGLCPHPLFDKLQYLAGDYPQYCGDKKSGYPGYLEQLGEWCAWAEAHASVRAVYTYLKKGCLIADLVGDGILFCDGDGKLLRKWNGDKEEMPPIFRQLADPAEAFVRVCVLDPDTLESRLFLDRSVQENYIAYQSSREQNYDLCYVQGVSMRTSVLSPSKIRNTGDKAKLISSNDSLGFTYRGNFTQPQQAVSLGYETTVKAHNALKWLIDRQGWKNGDQVILAWGTKNEQLPSLRDSFDDDLDFGGVAPEAETYTAYAQRFNQLLRGHYTELDEQAQVVVMALNSATPGRLSITYYREVSGSDFLQRLLHWYSTCTWRFSRAGYDEQLKKEVYRGVVSTPSPLEIAKAAYGERISDPLRNATVERLLPCILDRAPLPADLVRSAAQRAGNPAAMEEWEYRKTLSVACALIRKQRNDAYHRLHPTEEYKEVYSMNLEDHSGDRSYLFGRILAYYDNLESWALREMGARRMTNAMRLKSRFRQAPAKTAEILDRQLEPYLKKLGGHSVGRLGELRALYKKLDQIGGFHNAPLDEQYLLGYYCQLENLYQSKKESEQEKEEK